MSFVVVIVFVYRDRELAKVVVRKEDVELIVSNK